jgi:serine/threonine-protein kinase
VFADSAPPSRPTSAHGEGDLIAEKYRLVRRLGTGGMGEVWVANNEALGAKVAIKLIGTDYKDKTFVARLAQEAQAAASLGHPAIIRVFDFGKSETGAPFIAMELLHGEDLGGVLDRRGSITEIKAVQTLLPVIHALAAAHDKGIVHRDLKPANVFLARMDAGGVQPKLLDFGVAKLERSDFERVTHAGVLVGSPAYMSPEQARGEDVDRSADLWAVCVVLYELVTGTLPFNGENYNQLLWSIAHDHPVPTTTQFGGDAKLWAILARGFQKQRAGRWESMRDLGEALARWLDDQGVHEDIAGGSLKVAWLDRQSADGDVFGAEPFVIRPSAPDLRRLAPQRLENGLVTLGGDPQKGSTGALRTTRRAVALGAAVLVVLTFSIAFWMARPQPPKATSGRAPNAELRSEPTRFDPADVDRSSAPTVEPAASGNQEPTAGAVAPLEDHEGSGANAAASSQPAPVGPPRTIGQSKSRAQPWEKLKNPFD